jgi:hypothetical protein
MSSEYQIKNRECRDKSTECVTFPDSIKERTQWVITNGAKIPTLPWTDGKSWNNPANQTDFATARTYSESRDGSELGFVFSEDDPFVFIDFDDARDPDTGRIDPAVLALVERFETYTDVSTSGTGIHLIARGSLPDGTKSVRGPVGDDGASLEIYDDNRFAVMTGDSLASTPTSCNERQAALDQLVTKHESISEDTHDDAWSLPTCRLKKIKQVGETSDLDIIWDAVKHTNPDDISLQSTVTEERADGTKSLDPSWEHSDSGTRVGQFDDGFVYRDGMVGLDALQMVALEERIISDPSAYPSGDDYLRAVDALRERGAPIPEYHDPENRELALPDAEGLLDLSLTDLHERAQDDDADWPSTDAVRDKVDNRIRDGIRQTGTQVIKAPTASGKTHAVATTAWTANPAVTGGAPVLHLSKTRKARDEAHELSRQADVDSICLRAGEETCPITRGEHDRGNQYGNEPLDDLVTDGQTVSEWMSKQTRQKGIPHGRAHAALDQRNRDVRDEPLPCCQDGECKATTQWERIDLEQSFAKQDLPDVIHATHQFAHIASLVEGANVIFDERPEFSLDSADERVRAAVEAFLRTVDAPQETWEDFVTVALTQGRTDDWTRLKKAVEADPPDDWYLNVPEAHVYAPAITRAVVMAEEAGVQRYVGKVRYHPFYRGNEGGAERLMVVLNERYEFEIIKPVPPLPAARCVLGLDAHPTLARWQLDTLTSMSVEQVLTDEEQRRWRQFERGLLTVRVGEADRPLTGSSNFNRQKTRTLINELSRAAPELRTAVTSRAVEDQVETLLGDSADSPSVLHYGEELSRNDFSGESVGLVVGCIDPGDDNVLNWLALHDADAEPARSDADCEECEGTGCYECHESGKRRAHGRDFEGPDSNLAEELLASVRERHVAQGIGRYARNAVSPDEPTVVFVWTAAVPDELVEVAIPDVQPFTEMQGRVVEYVQEEEPVSTREISDSIDITKEGARKTLSNLVDVGAVAVDEGAGRHGAHLYEINRQADGILRLVERDESAEP